MIDSFWSISFTDTNQNISEIVQIGLEKYFGISAEGTTKVVK